MDASIDRLVWYAGWADKIAQVTGGANQVAGPYFNHSAPEPSGVIAVVAPKGPLLGLVSVVAPVIVTGNTAVVIASEPHPLTSITLAEVMATSDVPGGVVNILTGPQAEIGPWLASHMDVNGIDLTGVERPRAGPQPRDRGGREPQAGTPPRARGPARSPGAGPDDDLPGDEDRLAPDGRSDPPGRHTLWLLWRPIRMTLRGTSYVLAARATNSYDVHEREGVRACPLG